VREEDGGSESPTTIAVEVECDLDAQIAFDFRSASNCWCQATVTPGDASRTPKACPCTVCHPDWGNNPVHIDCSGWEENGGGAEGSAQEQALEDEAPAVPDPYVVQTCTSLDCAAACNGTCRLDCSVSDGSCPFCENNPANAPTPAPVGDAEEDGIANFGEKDRQSSAAPATSSPVVVGAAFLCAHVLMTVLA
jgi:hypothetical protein